MTLGNGIFFGWFRWLYLLVKTAAIYVGVFCVCYYWPLFVQTLIAPPVTEQTRFVATVMLAPLGFLVLGLTHGLASFALHALLLLAGIGTTYLIGPRPAWGDVTELIRAWLPVLAGVYLIGIGIGFNQQLKRFVAEE